MVGITSHCGKFSFQGLQQSQIPPGVTEQTTPFPQEIPAQMQGAPSAPGGESLLLAP